MSIHLRLPQQKPKNAYPAFGLALGLSLGAVSAHADVVLESGVAPHDGIDALYSTMVDAVGSLNSAAFSEIYAQDAFYLAPEAPLSQGIQDITAGWEGWFSWMKDGNGTLEMDFRIVARDVHNDTLGYDIAYATILQKRPNEADVTFASKFVVVTQRQPNGEWRYQVDAYNTLKATE